MSKPCPLCPNFNVESPPDQPPTGDLVKPGEKARATIINFSKTRCDGRDDYLLNANPLLVHITCRKKYTKRNDTKTNECAAVGPAGDASSTRMPLRSAVKRGPPFDIEKDCLICGKEAKDWRLKKGIKSEADRICKCEQVEFITTLKKYAEKRADKTAEAILFRLSNIIDLPAAGAVYHNKCRMAFFKDKKTPSGQTPSHLQVGFNKLCKFVEDNSECQFSISELEDIMNDTFLPSGTNGYTRRHLQNKLKDYFGDNVIITNLPGKPSVMTFRKTFSEIVHSAWYAERDSDQQSEKQRIVSTAADIVAADIRAVPCECDVYPSHRCLQEDMLKNTVPDTVCELIEGIVSQPNKSNPLSVSAKRKCAGIEHALMSAVRPRSYLSPLLIGLGVYLHRKYDSENLINILHSFGFCCSYEEVRRYQWSGLYSTPPPPDDEAFVQFIFDNADHNIKTIDGYDTFHCMGGLKCVTPQQDNSRVIKRIQKDPGSSEISKFGNVPHHRYCQEKKKGLRHIEVVDVLKNRTALLNHLRSIQSIDSLWLSSVAVGITPGPSWGGFNQLVTESMDNTFCISDTTALPFINLDPSDMSTIYTALVFAKNEATTYNKKYCIVTFDQPLFIKAVDIVHASSDLTDVIVRLGGLHMAFSYMGADGYIMSGSGVEQMWGSVYAAGSIPQITNGHYYYRGLRARILGIQALATILLRSNESFNELDIVTLQRTWYDLVHETISIEEALSTSEVLKVGKLLGMAVREARELGRTSFLWIEHFDRVLTLLSFIRAERTGNWNLHLDSVRDMLPTFHAAGHTHYARATTLYLQEMERLNEILPADDFEQYVSQGFFTIRRKHKFWSGVWTDMTIEQVLMRMMKVQGGLTRGRGISKSTLVYFISALPHCIPLMEAIEELTGVSCATTDQHTVYKQHKELRETRQRKDATDLSKFIDWLDVHNPFELKNNSKLMSVFTGLSADDSINCDKAYGIGLRLQMDMVGENFADLALKRSAKVRTLSAMTSTVKLKGEAVVVDQQLMLNRILAVIQSSSDLEQYIQFEFVNYAPSLFDNFSMRKNSKSSLCQALEIDKYVQQHVYNTASVIVIDGGHLLHTVIWPPLLNYQQILDTYVQYVKKHYSHMRVIVVFDGYGLNQTTKYIEHQRRSATKTSVDIELRLNAQPTTSQHEFLNNTKNKTSLIEVLSSALTTNGIEVEQASGDADLHIATSAINAADTTSESVAVLSRDTDVFVILLAKMDDQNMFLMQPQPGKPSKIIDLKKLKSDLGQDICDVLLPLHAVTGCDTTSAIFKIGKKKPMKLVKTSPEFRSHLAVFNEKQSTHDEISEAGGKLLLMMYGVKHLKSLNRARYFRFKQLVARKDISTNTQLCILPPTIGSARMHAFRVFLQVQSWHGNYLNPLEYGWENQAGNLLPIGSASPSAPERLIKLIYWISVSRDKMSSWRQQSAQSYR